jgi:ferric-dicitrate binding protein FerR (iron transport regulator)
VFSGQGVIYANNPKAMTDELDWTRAAKYLAGEYSAKERAEFEAWVSEDPARIEQLSWLEEAFRSSTLPAVDVGAAWSSLSARMEERPSRRGEQETQLWARAPQRTVFPLRKRPAAYWAVPALAAAALLTFFLPTIWQSSSLHRAGTDVRRIATATGERKSFALGDGISVILGPSTSLEVEQSIAERRTLRLSGEAYFIVAHDPQRQLSVQTASAVIDDIGTAFNVRAVTGIARTDVSVVDGVVALRSAATAKSSPALELRAGNTGTVQGTGAPTLSPVSQNADALAWTRGELIFRDAKLSEVALELYRWYGLQTTITDPSIGARTLSARFSGEPAEAVLTVIARTLGISYQLQGHRVTFSTRPK